MKAHLLSKVLLKRFCSKGKVRVHLLDTTYSYLSSPNGVAYVDVDDLLFKPIEVKYGYIETRMARAFRFLDEGTLLKHPIHVESVKKFIALHYVRAAIFYLLIQKEPESFNKFLKSAKLAHPNDEQKIEGNKDILRQELRKKMIKSLPSLIESLIKKVQRHIQKYDLEVGLAPNDVNFLIGDIAVLTRTENGTIGILSGAAVTNSTTFGMPLGPKHFVALTEKNKFIQYRQFIAKDVGSCNQKLLKQSVAEYYTLP